MLKLCFLAWLQMSTRKKILRVCRWHYSRVIFLAGVKKTYSASIMLLNFECQIWKKKSIWLDYWMINPCDYMLSKFMLLWGGLSGSVRFASDWWTRKLQVWSLLVQQHSLGDWSWNIFYGHSLPATDSAVVSFWQKNVYKYWLTLKAPRKPASENVVCLCRLLNILANFSNLFLYTGKQCGPWVWSGSTLFAKNSF